MQRGLKPIHTSFAALSCVTLLFFSHAMLVQAASWSPGPEITIQGRTFYKDGKPWILKGVHVGAFNRPKFIPSAPNGGMIHRRKPGICGGPTNLML